MACGRSCEAEGRRIGESQLNNSSGVEVGNEYIAASIQGYACRAVGTISQGVDRGVPTLRQNFIYADCVISDEEVAICIHCQAKGLGSTSEQGIDCGVVACRQDLLHRIVAVIGNENVATPVDSDARRIAKAAAERLNAGIGAHR